MVKRKFHIFHLLSFLFSTVTFAHFKVRSMHILPQSILRHLFAGFIPIILMYLQLDLRVNGDEEANCSPALWQPGAGAWGNLIRSLGPILRSRTINYTPLDFFPFSYLNLLLLPSRTCETSGRSSPLYSAERRRSCKSLPLEQRQLTPLRSIPDSSYDARQVSSSFVAGTPLQKS